MSVIEAMFFLCQTSLHTLESGEYHLETA